VITVYVEYRNTLLSIRQRFFHFLSNAYKDKCELLSLLPSVARPSDTVRGTVSGPVHTIPVFTGRVDDREHWYSVYRALLSANVL